MKSIDPVLRRRISFHCAPLSPSDPRAPSTLSRAQSLPSSLGKMQALPMNPPHCGGTLAHRGRAGAGTSLAMEEEDGEGCPAAGVRKLRD
jgi:hypothetical protein